ncbi:hypothetical protein K435DRAFT_771998 [Dendrothele bispora CBS 962.96]|uniref:Uncharacterized protein n=1 Tax=Dendrothele bispora (strain CBS 962.96) TaxID=1314807 RepID=A0A4V4HJ12_DENBC|nr:hypothetical protein K435DRAFT_771998 [Dendrothele bispora CBS 962.96]
MSRLTASPFHKPSPFQFPQVPLSPPETNSEHIPPSNFSASISVAGGIDGLPHVEPDVHRSQSQSQSQSSESPAARFRRVSSLAYHSSGLRESRERAVQKNYRYFVVVIPPPSFVQDHGQLGHTLSLGPQHRLSQGLLMPLLPTMYGQLNAIAREFNFPSTTGLCLYLHFTDNGITATPRISDESWQLIWNHVFEASSPSLKLPIVGKLEFDIDLRQARWYGSWLSSSHREQLDVPSSVVPSTAPSLSHYRLDSRTTELDLTLDDTLDTQSISPPSRESSAPTARHIPKKLSLVDRLDSFSVRSGSSRAPIRAVNMSPPDQVPSSSVLSPIHQEEEPKTATLTTKGDIEKKVNHWRASASLNPSALAARGQTSLEPANLPNTISLDDVMRDDAEDDDELNLEDFAWSVSSLGPPDYDDMESVSSWSRIPSVHMANRAEGSVCLTPSDCTSFGPSDYTLPPLSPPSERAFTPDLAGRMYEDAPMTPLTATSWGAPSEWPPSPLSEGRVSSVDLTYRMQLSRPSTPSTATSWGAPSEWPASPNSDGRASSIDFTYRMQISRPPTPSTATSWGPASWPASPATSYHVPTPDAAHRSFDLASEERPDAPWGHVWPYTTERATSVESVTQQPWGFVWPYNAQQQQQERNVGESHATWKFVWPYTQLSSVNSTIPPWSHVWPYRETNRSTGREEISVYLPCSYPSLLIYRDVYPFNLRQLYPSVQSYEVSQTTQSWVYPQSLDNIYPPVHGRASAAVKVSLETKTWVYPQSLNNIYPPVQNKAWVYPQSLYEIYPAVGVSKAIPTSKPHTVSVHLPCSYPSFQIYRPVYPCFNLYPAIPSKKPTEVYYPFFNLYPARLGVRESSKRPVAPLKPVTTLPYPVFNLYPAVYPYLEVYPAVKPSSVQSSSRQRNALSREYPDFDIYPAVKSRGYPDFDLYPAQQQRRHASSKFVDMKYRASYPYFDLYPSVYPHLTIYPSGEIKLSRKSVARSMGLKSAGYPDFNIYPVVRSKGYPDFCLYPPISRSYGQRSKQSRPTTYGYPDFCIYPPVSSNVDKTVKMIRSSGYPDFVLYPPVVSIGYPDFCLYPPVYRKKEDRSRKLGMTKMSSLSGYPDFVLYPPVMSIGYPDFCLYPPVYREKEDRSRKLGTIKMSGLSGYPDFVLYPPISGYPHFCLYPPVTGMKHKQQQSKKVVEAGSRSTYGFFDLYPAVYPNLVLYAPKSGELSDSRVGASRAVIVSLRSIASYPIFDLYPVVQYPFSLDHIYGTVRLLSSQSKTRPQEQYVSSSQWPVFQIYPVVEYPYSLDHIYQALPSSSRKQHKIETSDPWKHVWPYTVKAESSSSPKVAEIHRTRLTHAQLHKIVWASHPPRRHHKRHLALHEEVFDDEEVKTPSGNISLLTPSSLQVDMVARPRSRSGSIARRPPSTAPPMRGLPPRPDAHRGSPSPPQSARLSPTSSPVPTPPVVERRRSALPPRPDSFLHLKDTEPTAESFPAPKTVPTAPAELRTTQLYRSVSSVTPRSSSNELRSQSLQRSASSVSRPTPTVSTAELRITTLQRSLSSASRSTSSSIRRGPANLSPVDERLPELPRSTYSNSRPTVNVADRVDERDTPPRPLPKKRDSLVLQRARAFENNDDVEPILSKFPLPPRPAGPGLPSRVSSLQSQTQRFGTGR